jgi:hypothetical protein
MAAAIVAFVFSQIVIAAHTAKYGDGPHEHAGQVCLLSIAAPGGVKAISNTAITFAVFVAVWLITFQTEQTDRARLIVRASQPRGPPSL